MVAYKKKDGCGSSYKIAVQMETCSHIKSAIILGFGEKF